MQTALSTSHQSMTSLIDYCGPRCKQLAYSSLKIIMKFTVTVDTVRTITSLLYVWQNNNSVCAAIFAQVFIIYFLSNLNLLWCRWWRYTLGWLTVVYHAISHGSQQWEFYILFKTGRWCIINDNFWSRPGLHNTVCRISYVLHKTSSPYVKDFGVASRLI